MGEREFLFLSGEFSTTLQMCMLRDRRWTHTTTPLLLSQPLDGSRQVMYGASSKRYDAILWYSSVEVDTIRLHNLSTIERSGVPCWPPVELLRLNDDRHVKLMAARNAGLVDDVAVLSPDDRFVPKRDTVLKIGNVHVGEGKVLVRAGEQMPKWDGLASVEPFVVGRSVRVYVVDGQTWCVEYLNDESWIKNGPGADVIEIDGQLPQQLIDNAIAAHERFGFRVSASDYILREDGSFRFLEHNHFPGLTIHSQAEKAIKTVLSAEMDALERQASST